MSKLNDFKNELIILFEKYGYSISHEDHHGAFELIDFDIDTNDWLLSFYDKTSKEEEQ